MDKYSRYLQIQTLSKIWEGLSDSEKIDFIKSIQNNREVLRKLNDIETKVDRNKYSFSTDFLANVVGNYFADFTIFLASKIFRNIKL